MAHKSLLRPGRAWNGDTKLDRTVDSSHAVRRARHVHCRTRTCAQCLATESYGEEDVYEFQLPHEVEVRYERLLKRQDDQLRVLDKLTNTKRKTHSNLRVGAGYLKGSFLLSPRDAGVRPMMGKTKSAVFSMLLAQIGVSTFPAGSRWLDLFAGTGSVGIEALSRGCDTCHFVEMDHWTAVEVLGKNVESLKIEENSVTHIERVQDFLVRYKRNEERMGGKFDYVSVCPPYNEITFEELMSELDHSSIFSHNSFMFVEYPREQSSGIPQACGPLVQLKKRNYGRTVISLYGPPETS